MKIDVITNEKANTAANVNINMNKLLIFMSTTMVFDT